MAKKVRIKHKQSGMMKEGYFGFSWTYFFFGAFVPIFRGEIGIGCLHMVINMVSLGIFQLIMCFLYNKQYMSRMLQSGWTLDETDQLYKDAQTAIGFYNDPVPQVQEG
ncbi:MAG: hypothetical protein PHH87_10520 [Desulfuromonas sp.]|nr:hypothetical protein [Desulfuromonas sp.]